MPSARWVEGLVALLAARAKTGAKPPLAELSFGYSARPTLE